MRNASRLRATCPNSECQQHSQRDAGNVVLHGFSKVRGGRRRRYRCTACGKTFGATTGTPYKRLQHSVRRFDRVASLSVEGVNKSAIARLEGLSWNTVARWLELAAAIARRFNAKHLRGHELVELQLDEINTFLQSRKQQTWVFAGIDVWSRLWPATLVGSRTYRNTRRFVRIIADARSGGGTPLITTDGFRFYAPTIRHVFGLGCVLAQVIKKIKRNRVVRVGTKLIVGSEWKLADALEESEDSAKLNTSFIERLNLTIRQGCAYLRRRSPCHARKKQTLDDHLELFRAFYNFVRPHSALRFGSVTRTPAMQAGLAAKQLRFRDVFTARHVAARFAIVRSGAVPHHGMTERFRCAA
ncbi:MAG: transposase [bacterium]|nr:transposase [bacterium]